MLLLKRLLLAYILMFFTSCSATTKQENITLEKVGNYPDITRINRKMILSKDDKFLFVVNKKTSNKMDILDLSNLSKPKLLTQIVCSKSEKDFIYDYKISNNKKHLFVSIYSKVLIYNIENINQVELIKEFSMVDPLSLEVTPDNGYLYVSGSLEYGTSKINIFDIQNIDNITNLGIYKQYGHALKVSPNGKILFFSMGGHDGKSLGIADISNPKKPKLLDETAEHFNNRISVSTSAVFEDIVFSKDSKKLYIAGNQVGLMVYDISKNRLNSIQLTAGTHSKMMFNSTKSIYRISLDKNRNILYLGGVSDKEITYLKSIKGVNMAVLMKGKNILVSNQGDFVIVGNHNGLNIYLVQSIKG